MYLLFPFATTDKFRSYKSNLFSYVKKYSPVILDKWIFDCICSNKTGRTFMREIACVTHTCKIMHRLTFKWKCLNNHWVYNTNARQVRMFTSLLCKPVLKVLFILIFAVACGYHMANDELHWERSSPLWSLPVHNIRGHHALACRQDNLR